MPPESWLVLVVAAAFLLLGIAGSPLAWALLAYRRSRFEELTEQRWRTLTDELRALDDRLARFETINAARTEPSHLKGADAAGRPGGVHAADSFSRADGGLAAPSRPTLLSGRGSARADSAHEPPLIAVPTLEGAGTDRDVTAVGLKERHAAIWTMAETGATAEAIARATGHPVGQIELILGLRRQIDGTKSSSFHAPHG